MLIAVRQFPYYNDCVTSGKFAVYREGDFDRMKLEGIMPALVTPLKADETVNTEVLSRLIGYFLDKGANGFYVGGATGEGLALKTEERMILAEAATAAAGKRVPVIVQVAAADYRDAIALAKHAERVGADAVSATPPVFFQYDEDDVYNYYKGIADAVHIPLMIYYNPAAGFNMNAEFAARMFEVDNITSIKWTSPRYDEVVRLKELTGGEMTVINGPDEMLLMGLSAGADGGIGTTYNFMLEKYLRIYDCFKRGDIKTAQAVQTEANRIIAVLTKYKIIPAAKVLMEKMGFEVGDASFPMKRYTDEEKRRIVADFKAAGWEE